MEWAIFYENIDLPSWTYHPSAVEHGFTFYFRFHVIRIADDNCVKLGNFQSKLSTGLRKSGINFGKTRLVISSFCTNFPWLSLICTSFQWLGRLLLCSSCTWRSFAICHLQSTGNKQQSDDICGIMTNCRFGFHTPWKEGKGSNTWVTIFLSLREHLHHTS